MVQIVRINVQIDVIIEFATQMMVFVQMVVRMDTGEINAKTFVQKIVKTNSAIERMDHVHMEVYTIIQVKNVFVKRIPTVTETECVKIAQ